MRSSQDGKDSAGIMNEQLLVRAREGDSTAFNSIASEYEGIIAAKASLAHTKGVDFEDLLQEGYMALFNAVKTYSPDAGASFKTYATVCIGNRIASVARSNGSSKSRPFHDYSEISDYNMAADSNYEPEFAVFAGDRMNSIYRDMSLLLSETESRVMMLFLSGHSYGEIASVLNITEKAIDNALQRARRKLRAAINEQQ